MNELFPEKFLSSIERLSLHARKAPPRAAVGAHLSSRNGTSLEFRDYQQYAPGDDLRRVDWNVYSRTRHLFVRRFERPTSLPIYLLVDASESMRLETPSRYATAARLAAAVVSAAVANQNPVYLTIADGAGAGARRPLTGRRGFVRALAELSADRRPGGAGIANDLKAMLPFLASRGRGVLVLISDFFEPLGIDALLESLRLTNQRLVLLRVTQPADADPDLDGDYELEDCENGARLNVSAEAGLLERYREAYRSYFAALDTYATSRAATNATINAAADTVPQLERLFPGGVMSV